MRLNPPSPLASPSTGEGTLFWPSNAQRGRRGSRQREGGGHRPKALVTRSGQPSWIASGSAGPLSDGGRDPCLPSAHSRPSPGYFEHLGSRPRHDLDTLMYTLAGIATPEPGGDSRARPELPRGSSALGRETGFRLGAATSPRMWKRTRRLGRRPLAAVTSHSCSGPGGAPSRGPMTTTRSAPWVETPLGPS